MSLLTLAGSWASMCYACTKRGVCPQTPLVSKCLYLLSCSIKIWTVHMNKGKLLIIFLGTSGAFRRVYEGPIVASRQPEATPAEIELGEERGSELSRLIKLFMLRRTQEINNKYLPPKCKYVNCMLKSTLFLDSFKRCVNGFNVQYTPSVSQVRHIPPKMSDKFESQHSLSPTIWSDIFVLVGRESGY